MASGHVIRSHWPDRFAPHSVTNLAGFYCVLVIPDFWFNMTGITLSGGPKNSGEDFLPFYFGTAKTDFLQPSVGLFVDGQDQSIGAGQGEKTDCERVNFGTPERSLWLNTTGLWFRHDRLANGVHALQLRSSINLNYIIGQWTQTVTVSNHPVQVLITNQITYTNWDDLIWNNTNFTFKAQSTEPRVNWRIKVYGASGRFMNEKTGFTTNGHIQWTWDLRDQSGQVHDDSDIDHVFFSNIKIWPLNKPEDDGDNVSESNAWWDERLGHEFARKYSPFNRRPALAVGTNLPGQYTPTRPQGLSNALADPTLP
jgi:hypothetical protein